MRPSTTRPDNAYPVGDRSVLDAYPNNTAVIWYRINGSLRVWAVGAHATRDNEATIREHLAKWLPNAEFVTCCLK